ncbi:MAG: hypothetical protein WC433_06725 [Candidatus Omnitrophota bacterium]
MTDQNAIVPMNSFIAPVTDIDTAIKRYNAFKEFVSKVLVKDHDYGEIPGTKKPTLLKAGAEKLGAFFGIRPVFVLQESVNDWTGKDHGEPFFFREYKCQGYRNGELIGEGVGSCNSFEKKYRYRWMNELEVPGNIDKSMLEFQDGSISEFAFAIQKAETSGKYGKPAEYWQQFKDAIENGTARSITRKTKKGEDMDAYEIGGKLYAVPNRDVADQVNTIDKMAQKRALVAMILIATNASDYFTQDMEDFTPSSNPNNIDPDFVEGSFKEVTAAETFAKEAGAETGELFKYLDGKVVKMVAKVRGLTTEDAAKGLQEWLTNGRIKKEMTLAQFEALAKVD